MSPINEISEDLSKVLYYVETYNKELEQFDNFFNLDGKKIEYICKEVPKSTVRAKYFYSRCKSFTDFLELKREEVEGKLWKKYIEGSRRTLDKKEIQMFIKQEPEWIAISELLLEIEYLRRGFENILSGLDILHWQLNNIVKLRVASLHEEIF